MNKLEKLALFPANNSVNKDAPTNMHNEYWHRKVDRPPNKYLKKEVEKLGYSKTGRNYGVSDNAVRKWLKFYENQPGVLN